MLVYETIHCENEVEIGESWVGGGVKWVSLEGPIIPASTRELCFCLLYALWW